MKKIYVKISLATLLLSNLSSVVSQNVAINTTGAPGNSAAILDMSANKTTGILTPRVSITNTNSPTCIVTLPEGTAATAPDGLLVYDTNSATTGGSGIGYYYWSHTNLQWEYLQNSGAGSLVGVKVFTSATYTYTPDPGTNTIWVKMIGGGGGGGGAAAATAPGGNGGGGGSGAYCELSVSGVVYTANYYTGSVGQGGSGGASTPAAGNPGTATTFNVNTTTYTANGGSGGALGSNASTTYNSNAGGAGGSTSTTISAMVMSVPGTAGGYGLSSSVVGNIVFTGIVVAFIDVLGSETTTMWGIGTSGEGGSSVFGGQGHPVGGNATAGIAALSNTGSGGSGGSANYQGSSVSSTGGAGAAGVVLVYEYR